MCLNYNQVTMLSPRKPKAAPRSPWRKMIRQQIKPKLNRNIVKTSKVNLNLYWSQFEGMPEQEVSLLTLQPTRLFPKTWSRDDNYVNENLANEMQELENN